MCTASKATDNYCNVVWKGAFGTVFKGTVQHVAVVVKLLDPVSLPFGCIHQRQICDVETAHRHNS